MVLAAVVAGGFAVAFYVASRHIDILARLLVSRPGADEPGPRAVFAADPCALVVADDVEVATGFPVAAPPRRDGPRAAPGGPYLTCVFSLPHGQLTVNVVQGAFTPDGFDSYSAVLEARRPGSALPVPGLGDRATYNPHHSAMRVLAGDAILTATAPGINRPEEVTRALLGVALTRLPGPEATHPAR